MKVVPTHISMPCTQRQSLVTLGWSSHMIHIHSPSSRQSKHTHNYHGYPTDSRATSLRIIVLMVTTRSIAPTSSNFSISIHIIIFHYHALLTHPITICFATHLNFPNQHFEWLMAISHQLQHPSSKIESAPWMLPSPPVFRDILRWQNGNHIFPLMSSIPLTFNTNISSHVRVVSYFITVVVLSLSRRPMHHLAPYLAMLTFWCMGGTHSKIPMYS